MAQKIEIHAEVREDVGKGASRRLRRSTQGVPGIIYGGDADPVVLTLNGNELSKAMEAEAFFSQILEVVVDGKKVQAVVRDLQRFPASGKVLHVDFMRISADKPIQVSVPFRFVDEDKCIGVLESGGVVSHNMTDVEISCLPADLPEFIEVYMAELDLNQVVHLSDIALPEGVTIVALGHGEDYDSVIVSVYVPRVIEEIEEIAEEELEVGVEEGDEAAEGEAAEGDAEGEPSDD